MFKFTPKHFWIKDDHIERAISTRTIVTRNSDSVVLSDTTVNTSTTVDTQTTGNDTDLIAGKCNYTFTCNYVQSDTTTPGDPNTTRVIVTYDDVHTVALEHKLALICTVSDVFTFANGHLKQAWLRLTTTTYTVPASPGGSCGASSFSPSPGIECEVHGAFANTALPADVAAFDALWGTADEDLFQNDYIVTVTSWMPGSAKNTLLFLLGSDTDNKVVKLHTTLFPRLRINEKSTDLTAPTILNENKEYDWHDDWERLADGKYRSKWDFDVNHKVDISGAVKQLFFDTNEEQKVKLSLVKSSDGTTEYYQTTHLKKWAKKYIRSGYYNVWNTGYSGAGVESTSYGGEFTGSFDFAVPYGSEAWYATAPNNGTSRGHYQLRSHRGLLEFYCPTGATLNFVDTTLTIPADTWVCPVASAFDQPVADPLYSGDMALFDHRWTWAIQSEGSWGTVWHVQTDYRRKYTAPTYSGLRSTSFGGGSIDNQWGLIHYRAKVLDLVGGQQEFDTDPTRYWIDSQFIPVRRDIDTTPFVPMKVQIELITDTPSSFYPADWLDDYPGVRLQEVTPNGDEETCPVSGPCIATTDKSHHDLVLVSATNSGVTEGYRRTVSKTACTNYCHHHPDPGCYSNGLLVEWIGGWMYQQDNVRLNAGYRNARAYYIQKDFHEVLNANVPNYDHLDEIAVAARPYNYDGTAVLAIYKGEPYTVSGGPWSRLGCGFQPPCGSPQEVSLGSGCWLNGAFSFNPPRQHCPDTCGPFYYNTITTPPEWYTHPVLSSLFHVHVSEYAYTFTEAIFLTEVETKAWITVNKDVTDPDYVYLDVKVEMYCFEIKEESEYETYDVTTDYPHAAVASYVAVLPNTPANRFYTESKFSLTPGDTIWAYAYNWNNENAFTDLVPPAVSWESPVGQGDLVQLDYSYPDELDGSNYYEIGWLINIASLRQTVTNYDWSTVTFLPYHPYGCQGGGPNNITQTSALKSIYMKTLTEETCALPCSGPSIDMAGAGIYWDELFVMYEDATSTDKGLLETSLANAAFTHQNCPIMKLTFRSARWVRRVPQWDPAVDPIPTFTFLDTDSDIISNVQPLGRRRVDGVTYSLTPRDPPDPVIEPKTAVQQPESYTAHLHRAGLDTPFTVVIGELV